MAEKEVDFQTINYVEQPLSVQDLKSLLAKARLRPHEALRKNEAAYREHVQGKNLSDEQLLQVMARHPEVMQRPIVVRENRAVLARPVERLADLGID